MSKENRKNNKDFWIVKCPMSLKPKLDEVRRERIKNNMDMKMKSYSELLDATTRYGPLWEILKKAQIKKVDKK